MKSWPGETVPTSTHTFSYTLREPSESARRLSRELSADDGDRKIAQPIAAGNTIVLKPASATPVTASMLGRLALEAGIPAGVINVATGAGAEDHLYLGGRSGVA